MKILYFGTVCDLKAYDRLLGGCRVRPSVAPIVFETALLEGLKENGADVEILSYPMIPAFPAGRLLYFGGQRETLPCGYVCRWLRSVNLPVIKQMTRRLDARRTLKRWLKENTGNGVIVTYSIPPFLVGDILKYAGRYGVKTAAIIPDLLRDMYINEDRRSPVTKLKQLYLAPALRLQGEYDGYIYLTEGMREAVAPGKPYIVMEGMAGASACQASGACGKAPVRAIMYAGMLHEKYGVLNLLDAFEALEEENTELWMFGSGTAVPEIRRRAAQNHRIRYFGTVSRDEILAFERKATLLVNPRDPHEAFTRYSFPSKTIEYMLSGTPLVTTRLEGIPNEYFDYVFDAPGNRAEDLRRSLQAALAYSADELNAFGARAQRFIAENKSACRQAERILDFLKEVTHGTSA